MFICENVCTFVCPFLFIKIMKKGEITTSIILEKRKPYKNGKYPVKLRVTFKREQRYYTLRNSKDEADKTENAMGEVYAFTVEEFEKIRTISPSKSFKHFSIKLNALEKRATDVIKSLSNFTFQSFEKMFFSEVEDEMDLFSAIKNTIKKLRIEGRISTAITFECTINSLQNFIAKKTIQFSEIDIEFLNKYEKWMLKRGNGAATIGIYVRNIRTMYNQAKNNGLIDAGMYPFGLGKYEIPTSRNVKKALSHKEVGLIANYPSIDGTGEQLYRDYWLFSYLCNGINVKDIAFLKYSNISSDLITLIRAKTKQKEKQNPRPITIVITKMAEQIIFKWGNKPASLNKYIFPIVEEGLTPQQEYLRVQQTTKMINKYINRISLTLGINQKVTSYSARHSFATVLKRSGASTEYIGESLGHSNLKTTQNYLADFEVDTKRKWAERLSDF